MRRAGGSRVGAERGHVQHPAAGGDDRAVGVAGGARVGDLRLGSGTRSRPVITSPCDEDAG